MSRRDIATFGLKLLGVYALIRALSHTEAIGIAIAGVGSGYAEEVGLFQWALMALPFVLLLVSGLLLVFCAEQIGRIIVVGDQETVSRGEGGACFPGGDDEATRSSLTPPFVLPRHPPHRQFQRGLFELIHIGCPQ